MIKINTKTFDLFICSVSVWTWVWIKYLWLYCVENSVWFNSVERQAMFLWWTNCRYCLTNLNNTNWWRKITHDTRLELMCQWDNKIIWMIESDTEKSIHSDMFFKSFRTICGYFDVEFHNLSHWEKSGQANNKWIGVLFFTIFFTRTSQSDTFNVENFNTQGDFFCRTRYFLGTIPVLLKFIWLC